MCVCVEHCGHYFTDTDTTYKVHNTRATCTDVELALPERGNSLPLSPLALAFSFLLCFGTAECGLRFTCSRAGWQWTTCRSLCLCGVTPATSLSQSCDALITTDKRAPRGATFTCAVQLVQLILCVIRNKSLGSNSEKAEIKSSAQGTHNTPHVTTD